MDSANPLLGKLIGGKYRVRSVLGRGGMGTVFLAIHEVSLVPVAVKILHPRFASRSEYRAWFLSEANKAGLVAHENSARVHDVGESPDGSIYIAMEYVEGVTLAEWLAGGRVLGPMTTLTILEQMLYALEDAHDAGVVHSDLTPRNVMVTMRGEEPVVKILDFGIAKGANHPLPVLRHASSNHSTATPHGFASPPYSAPEYLEGKEVDARADLYSLGVIAYRCLSGHLPIEGDTGAEMAQATIAGRLEPLGPIPGLPPRFHRLVESLLARDPEQRPASAAMVAAELGEIRKPRGHLLRMVSLVSLVTAMLMVAVAYTPRGSAYLRPAPGAQFVLHGSKAEAAAAPQDMQSKALEVWRLEYGGFEGQRLRIALWQRDRQIEIFDLRPELGGRPGVLRLTRSDAGYRGLCELLAQHAGSDPVTIVFGLPGGEFLAASSLRIDDRPPSLSLEFSGESRKTLTGNSALVIDCGDDGDVAQLVIHAESAAFSNRSHEISVAVNGRRSIAVAHHLAAKLLGIKDHGELKIRVEGRDRAGNLGVSKTMVFEHTDFRAPSVLLAARPGGGQLLTYGNSGARMEILLSVAETGLTVVIKEPNGEVVEYQPEYSDDRVLQVVLAPPATRESYLDGRYEISVRDRFENVGESRSVTLRFSTANPSPRLELAADHEESGRAILIEKRVITNGQGVVLRFLCNPIYSAHGASLTGRDGDSIDVKLAAGAPGEAKLSLPALPDGLYRLGITMMDQRGGSRREVVYDLRSLASPIRLSLPIAHRGRVLPDLIENSLLIGQGKGFGLGLAWRWVPDDLSLIRGRFWIGGEGALEPLPEIHAVVSREKLLTGFVPRSGLNRLALELRDVFARPLEVFIGDVLEGSFNGAPGEAVLVFYHHSQPFAPRERIIALEYQRPLRLELESVIPFASEDQVVLSIGGVRLDPVRRSSDGRQSYLFHLPFDDVVRVAGIAGLAEEHYPNGRNFRLPVTIDSPIGAQEIELLGRTVRSSLARIRLGDIVENQTVINETIARMSMVPILSPVTDATFEDPVLESVQQRMAFRPFPPIATHNILDFYLSAAELTRAEYQAIIVQAFDDDRGGIRGWRSFVHHADPLGEGRLAIVALIPQIHVGDVAAWAELLDAAPDRPVTGVNFFQAYTVARLVGYLIAADPSLLRLPLGVELEMAALRVSSATPGTLNGAASDHSALGGVSRMRFLSVLPLLNPKSAWPLTRDECIEAGDRVDTELGDALVGLDFGVREWVFDVPYTEELRPWFGDHGQLLAIAEDLATGGEKIPSGRHGRAEILGVVRGLAIGERRGLVDALEGHRLSAAVSKLPRSVPGVVRSLVLRRDARGMFSRRSDPHLHLLGFRLAGDRRLINRVRRR